MTSSEISSNKNWEEKHLLLDLAFKEEIRLMRELLANLHQEELSLLENVPYRWIKSLEDRSDLIVELGTCRIHRMEVTTSLTKYAIKNNKSELLPPDEGLSCEILNKLDQIIALNERINLQNCRNAALFEQRKHQETIPLHCNYPHPLKTKKRKTNVATYFQKD